MRAKPLNNKEIQESFEKRLQAAIDLGSFATGGNSGLDEETSWAIDLVADAYPNIDPSLIQNARKEFAKQLDGQHGGWMRESWAKATEGYDNS